MKVLHLGSGLKNGNDLKIKGIEDLEIITLDMKEELNPDIVCKLGVDSISLPDDSVDLAVAYHLLEHIGKQGETDEWFFFFEDLYRVLKPEGILQFLCPLYSSVWAWADPSHTRALSPESFNFICQDSYRIKESAISPYRIRCDFNIIGFELIKDSNKHIQEIEKYSHFRGEIKAKKPLKVWWEDNG